MAKPEKTVAAPSATVVMTSTQEGKAVENTVSLEQAQRILDYQKRRKHSADQSWSIKQGQPFTVNTDGKIVPTTSSGSN